MLFRIKMHRSHSGQTQKIFTCRFAMHWSEYSHAPLFRGGIQTGLYRNSGQTSASWQNGESCLYIKKATMKPMPLIVVISSNPYWSLCCLWLFPDRGFHRPMWVAMAFSHVENRVGSSSSRIGPEHLIASDRQPFMLVISLPLNVSREYIFPYVCRRTSARTYLVTKTEASPATHLASIRSFLPRMMSKERLISNAGSMDI